MEIYNYDRVTGEYVGSTEARPNPCEPGNFLIPASATEIAPPGVQEGFARCFRDGSWRQVEDNREKTIYMQIDGSPAVMGTLGPIPFGFTLLVPPEYPKWENSAWTVDEVAKAAAESAQLKVEAQAALDKSDITVLRCSENNILVPEEWAAYRTELRRIVFGSSSGPIPVRPNYPPGT